MPEGIKELTRLGRRVKPDAVVWEGDRSCPRPTRVESLGSADRSARMRARFLEEEQETRDTIQQNSTDQRSPGSLGSSS